MTIESNIIQFNAVRRQPLPPAADGSPLSETGRNEQLRRKRRDVWHRMSTKLDYWTAWRKLHSEINRAFDCGFLDELDCPAPLIKMHDFEKPYLLDNEIRHSIQAAEIELLLTPAPDVAAIQWKRKTFAKSWYQCEDADAVFLRKHFRDKPPPFRDIERAIADDEAWLMAHPARQCRSNSSRRGPT